MAPLRLAFSQRILPRRRSRFLGHPHHTKQCWVPRKPSCKKLIPHASTFVHMRSHVNVPRFGYQKKYTHPETVQTKPTKAHATSQRPLCICSSLSCVLSFFPFMFSILDMKWVSFSGNDLLLPPCACCPFLTFT